MLVEHVTRAANVAHVRQVVDPRDDQRCCRAEGRWAERAVDRRHIRAKTIGRAWIGQRRIDRQRDAACCRSEEHTSELQSLMRISYAVFCLTKKTKNKEQA